MADNIILNPGVDGAVVATDEVGGVHYPVQKTAYGADGAGATLVTPDAPLPMAITPGTYGTVPRTSTFAFTYLTSDGLAPALPGLANANAIGDYSVTPTRFFLKPSPLQTFFLGRMIVQVIDQGTFDTGDYGNGITLTNGIKVFLGVGDPLGSFSVFADLTPIPILVNPDWGRQTFDSRVDAYGSGNEVLTARWDLSEATDRAQRFTGVEILGSLDEFWCVELNDDFTGLNGQYFFVQAAGLP